MCFLVIKKGRLWTRWRLHDNKFSICCSQRVKKTPPVLKLWCYSQSIMLRLWMIQVTFVNKFIKYWLTSLTYYSSYNCWTHTIIFCYCNLRIASDQITQCNAESFSGGKGSLIFVSCFSISCAIHAKSSSKTVGDFRKYLKKKMSSCNHQSSLTFFFLRWCI